jgi:hypothetical protein
MKNANIRYDHHVLTMGDRRETAENHPQLYLMRKKTTKQITAYL